MALIWRSVLRRAAFGCFEWIQFENSCTWIMPTLNFYLCYIILSMMMVCNRRNYGLLIMGLLLFVFYLNALSLSFPLFLSHSVSVFLFVIAHCTFALLLIISCDLLHNVCTYIHTYIEQKWNAIYPRFIIVTVCRAHCAMFDCCNELPSYMVVHVYV